MIRRMILWISARVMRVRNRLTKFSIRVHISVLFLLILLVSTLLSGSLYRQLYGDMALSRVSDASLLTLDSIRANLDAVIRNANNTSKMILSDSDLQALLATGDLYSDLRLQGRIRSFLYKVLQDTPDIDSIHLFDNAGNQYTISRRIRQSQPEIILRETPWYQDTLAAKGAYVLRLNGDGYFPGDEDGNRVSLIRTVRDINTTDPLGTLVVNISEDAFHQAFGTINRQNGSGFYLLDGNGMSILRYTTLSETRKEALSSFLASGESNARELRIEGVSNLVSFQRESVHGWTLISLIPTDILSNENMPVFLTGFIVIGLNGLLLFAGLLLVSRMITTPIGKMLDSMRQVEAGVLEPWNIRAGNREVLQLRDNYNRMIERIRLLLYRVVVEQKAKRKHELNVLQAQIKPHFLYNTLDSINALALMGEKESVVQIVDALGVYYRLSLGRGREVVTVEDETEMVRQYLSIQKIRYADLFEVVYNLDGRAGAQPMLKLVLQPLVENALYHGIRASGRKGTLWLTTCLEEQHVRITLSDDGCGMKQETIERVLAAEWEDDPPEEGRKAAVLPSGSGSGFGLRGTVERLRIFYGRNDVMTIVSDPGKGTRITLLIPTGDAWFVKGTERILNGDASREHDTLLHEMMTEEDGT